MTLGPQRVRWLIFPSVRRYPYCHIALSYTPWSFWRGAGLYFQVIIPWFGFSLYWNIAESIWEGYKSGVWVGFVRPPSLREGEMYFRKNWSWERRDCGQLIDRSSLPHSIQSLP